MKKIAIIDEVHSVLVERLTKLGFECVQFTNQTKIEIQAKIHKYHGIVVRSRFPMDLEFLKFAKNLEFIARSGAGMENIDVDYCNSNSIQLFNAPEGNRNAVGEHALGMILSLFNNLSRGDCEVRNGEWNRERNRGVELEGKTVGVIGYGNNGKAFVDKLLGFNTRVIVYDKYISNFGNDNVEEVGMAEIFKFSDIISFHIPQNEETLFLVDDAYINKFDKSIYIINLSRGKIIRTSSLVRAIKSGKVMGTCLDVLEYEKTSFEDIFNDFENIPVDFKYLLESNKALLSPHVGGWTKESYFKLSNVLTNKIINFYKQCN